MLFLANMLSKMKTSTPLGSRIAEVHNGSSLFTAMPPGREQHPALDHRERLARSDRRAAPEYVLQHRYRDIHLGPEQPEGAPSPTQVQLIDATKWSRPMRKNLGKKNCELSDDEIAKICDAFLAFEETEQSKILPNEAFGYWKVTVERPLRIKG